MRMNLTKTCELSTMTGVKAQYLMLHYTWNTMVLSELFEEVGKQPNCSVWAKKPYIRKVDKSTRSYFTALCDEPHFIDYPSQCPLPDK
uniref:Lipocalin n=1 Tax=Rhipicephalus appendiculatus TaxID=34631 RepID=A0A131YJ21_RHIAP